ncbi:hypothetical protein KFU94_60200 [Chloroflexi bacterium TSY]|nr:hypothetical protein [Chloroflexi bacterium TSY]
MNEPKPIPYDWDELRSKWRLEQLTVEQAIGQLITWGQQHEDRLVALMREMEGLAQSLADLNARLPGGESRL